MNTMDAAGAPATVGFDARDLAEWSGGRWEPRPPPFIGMLSNDTRTLATSATYIALAGERFDGHTFVPAACAAGASAAIVRADWSRTIDAAFPLLRVPDTGVALSRMGAAYRRKLGLHAIGITGSAGKTTVKELVAATVATRFVTARTQGNWNNKIGLPLSLLAADPAARVGIFELGTNHPGEIGELAATLQPDWGIVTNIAAGHIEFFPSVEAIAEEKAELLRALPPGGLAFLNRNEPQFERLRAASAAPVVTIATRGDADYRLCARSPSNDRVEAEESATGTRFQFALSTGGEFQVANALFAIAVARRLGVDPRAIEPALAAGCGLPMRWQRHDAAGILVINDAYNANPLSMRAALEAFREERVAGARWLVLGGMLELGGRTEAEHLALGRRVADGAWAGLIVVGKLGKWIAQGAEAAGYPGDRVCRCDNAEAAAAALADRARPGDGVLLKASRGAKLEAVWTIWARARGLAPT